MADATGAFIASRVTCLAMDGFLQEPDTGGPNHWARGQFVVGTVDGTLSVIRVAPRVHADTHVSSAVLFQAVLAEELLAALPAHVAGGEGLDVLAYTHGGRLIVYSGSVAGDTAALIATEPASAAPKPARSFLSKLSGSGPTAAAAPALTPAEVRKVGEQSVRKLQADIAALTTELADLRASAEAPALVSIAPKAPLSLALRVTRVPGANAFRLVCEAEVPLDMVAIESSCPITL